MAGEKDHALAAASWPEIVQRIRARTPARLLVGRAGSAYPTSTQLELREAHAAHGMRSIPTWPLVRFSVRAF